MVDSQVPTASGADAPDPAASSRSGLPREFLALLVLVALLAVGIVLAWTFVGSKSPERLAAETAGQLAGACAAAQDDLRALPNPFPREGADRVARIRAENEILRTMVVRFEAVEPEGATRAEALRGWTTDWSDMIDARERYASDLETKRRAQFVLPADRGVKPITANMDDYVRQNHPHLDACFTEELALDTVEGPREYRKVTQ